MQQLQNYIDNLNRFFNVDNDTRIGFYMKCEIGFIDDDDHLLVGDVEAWGLIIAHKERGCINVHITDDLRSDATGVHYRARFFGVDGIFLNRDTYTRPDLASTLSHEVGHYFELDHTHQYSNRGKCRKEAIDRNRTWPFIMFCPFGGGGPSSQKISEATGDFLRDTPADHDLNSNLSCNYVITGQTDPWGDQYETPPAGSLSPDTRNILSYNGLRGCRDVFSRLQIAVMLHSIERGKSKNNRNAWKDARAEYDEYEMDNFSVVARNITLNEIQERNFHQQYEETGTVWSQCDVDWVRFIAPCNSNFAVFTSSMPNRTNANTRLTLFNNALVQLAQNDDISATNHFSSIQFSFVAGTEYLIRVENMSNLVTGYYNLQVGPTISITGNSTFCNSENFTINNLPVGATVTWSATPTGLVSFNPQGPTTNPTTTVTKIAAGNVTIQATVNTCNTLIEIQKPVVTENLPVVDYLVFTNGIQENGFFCSSHYGNEFEVIISPPIPSGGTLEYRILSWPNLNVVYTHPNSVPLGVPISVSYTPTPGWYVIEVKITTPCGTNDWVGYEVEYVDCTTYGRNQYFTISASPNPTSGELNVTTDKEKAEVKALSKTERVIYQLYDFNRTNIVKQWSFDNSQNRRTLNVSGLKTGQYILVVSKGKYRQSTQIIIK